jgi:hypothetical protein
MDNGRSTLTARGYFDECRRLDNKVRFCIKRIHRTRRGLLGMVDIDKTVFVNTEARMTDKQPSGVLPLQTYI